MEARETSRVRPDAEVAEAAANAFGRALTDGAFDDFVGLLTDDVQYEAPSVLHHTVMKLNGPGEVRRYLEASATEYEDLVVVPDEVRDLGGGRFLLVGRWRAKPTQSAVAFATPLAAVLDVSDGKVVQLRAFFDEQLAIDAARRD